MHLTKNYALRCIRTQMKQVEDNPKRDEEKFEKDRRRMTRVFLEEDSRKVRGAIGEELKARLGEFQARLKARYTALLRV